MPFSKLRTLLRSRTPDSAMATSHPLAQDLEHVLGRTRDLWEDVRGQRVFITGGMGFLGCWMLESFAWANERLGLNASATLLAPDGDDLERKAPHLAADPAITLLSGDARRFPFPAGKFALLLHLEDVPPDGDDPIDSLDALVEGTRRVLEFAAHCGARKLLLASSGAVYGRQPPELRQTHEEFAQAPDPTRAESAYGEGKRVSELLCSAYGRAPNLETKIARCYTFVGPHLGRGDALGGILRDALAGGPVCVPGDGTPFVSYLYAADAAAWLWTILLRGRACRPYNVGSEEAMPLSEVAHLVARSVRPSVRVTVAGLPQRGRPAERYVPSTRRARDELGLRQTINLEEGIRRSIAWQGLQAGRQGTSPPAPAHR